MAAITVKTDLSKGFARVAAMLQQIRDKDYLLRPVAVELIPMITERIHQKGIASDGSQIGTYSPEYMKVRTGRFQNTEVFSKGKKKGKPKNAGTFTRGARAGEARPRYNRSSDTKVIVSLTRQLENDWSVLETETGYGIGFTNSFNADKMRWVEANQRKTISSLTQNEIDYAFSRIEELVRDAINL